MKNYTAIIICLFLACCSTPERGVEKDDSSIKIDLTTVYDAPGRGFLILYPVSEMEDSLLRQITFPDLSGISDTAFAKIFFTGANHSALENNIMILMGNLTSPSPLIWVDDNNDLDFSEAKSPLRFSENFIDISIPNTNRPELVHTIRFHKPDSSSKADIKKVIEQYITKGESFIDFYMDERRNIRVGDFVYHNDSIRIGLIDSDVNGSYNNIGTDRILTGSYKGNINGTEEIDGAVILDSTTYFQGGSYAFEVIQVQDNGTSILIKPAVKDKIKDRIKKGESIPDFTFQLYSGEETSVYHYLNGNRYLYLNFWASWCSGCHQEIDDLKKIDADYSDKVTVVSLNYNEGAEKIKSFLDKYAIQWLNGFSTSEINKKLSVQGLPRNILIDSSGRIIEMDIHPSKLLQKMGEL